jgi:elongation factor G
MGELHLEVLVDRMVREFSVNVNVGKPKVAYKETLTGSSKGEGRFEKQTGSGGQFAEVKVKARPGSRGSGFVFENKCSPEVIPAAFIPIIRSGIEESLKTGILAGYEMVDVEVDLTGGRFDERTSTEVAFQAAASMAVRDALEKGTPTFLEPIMRLEVTTSEQYLGEVMADLSGRRGKVQEIFDRSTGQVIRAEVPIAEMFGYANSLRSLTQGRANYTLEFGSYETVPDNMLDKLVVSLRGF